MVERGCAFPGETAGVDLCYSVDAEATMDIQFTAVFQKVPEGYIAFVEELPGANTQGGTIGEARGNLQEAISLVLEANRILAAELCPDDPAG